MKFIFLIYILSALFFSCTSTQKNNDVCGDVRTPANAEQCAILFSQQKLNTKNPIVNATDSEILKYMDALVIEHLKISTSNQHGIDQSLKQALETVEKTLKQIFEKDPKYREIYKLKFTAKSKDYNKVAKSKDKEKRELDETKRKIIEDSLPEAFSQAKQKIIFHQMRPGKFMMGQIGDQVVKKIDQPFSMMSTQFTQMMWARLKIAMGETDINKINPSKNKTGTDSIKVYIEGIDVEMNPDHPVEQVSWDDITEFIRKLNDLSKLDEPNTQKLLKKLIPDHQKNDNYDLPTSKQWQFVMRDRGNANNHFFDKADDTDLSKYAWYIQNSGNQSHAVAQLMPRIIDGKPFYDLEGNVAEWTKSLFNSSYRVDRGGGFTSYSFNLRSGDNNGSQPGYRTLDIGFRLVRTNR